MPTTTQKSKKMLKCPVCGRTFTGGQGLAAHLRHRHGEGTSLAATMVQAAPAPATRSEPPVEGKEAICPHCGKTLRNTFQLGQHIRYRHAGTSATAPADVHAGGGSGLSLSGAISGAQRHLQTALEELRQRQQAIDADLSKMDALRAEKEAIERQMKALNTAIDVFNPKPTTLAPVSRDEAVPPGHSDTTMPMLEVQLEPRRDAEG